MDVARLVDELMGIAQKAGIQIRVEPLRTPNRGAGGFCRLKGQPVVLLERHSRPVDRAWVLTQAMERLGVDLQNSGLTAEAREVVLKTGQTRLGRRTATRLPRARARTSVLNKPGLRSCRGRRR